MTSELNQSHRILSRPSDLTGEILLGRLKAAGWSRADFARFAGMSRQMVDKYISGQQDGKIPMLVLRAVEYIERHPVELLALPELQTPVRQTLARKAASWEMMDRPDHQRRGALAR